MHLITIWKDKKLLYKVIFTCSRIVLRGRVKWLESREIWNFKFLPSSPTRSSFKRIKWSSLLKRHNAVYNNGIMYRFVSFEVHNCAIGYHLRPLPLHISISSSFPPQCSTLHNRVPPLYVHCAPRRHRSAVCSYVTGTAATAATDGDGLSPCRQLLNGLLKLGGGGGRYLWGVSTLPSVAPSEL